MTAAQFKATCGVTEELGAIILAAWVKDHPEFERPVNTMEVPWGGDVYTLPGCGSLVDIPMDAPARIVIEGVQLEYRAGSIGVDGIETLFFSVRMVGELKITRRRARR